MAQRFLIASYNEVDDASEAYDTLLDNGVHQDSISVFMTRDTRDRFTEESSADKEGVGEGLGTGAATGAVAGGLIGLVASGVTAAVAGLPTLVVVGPIAAMLGLTGVAATTTTGATTGALAGGLIGALSSMGVGKERAEEYERTIKEGGVVLIVNLDMENENVVKDILSNANSAEFEYNETM